MTFDKFVLEQLGPRPIFTKGNYSPDCRAWDARYVRLLNGGSDVTLPIYHPKRRQALEVSDAA
jgi:hypothetical protein